MWEKERKRELWAESEVEAQAFVCAIMYKGRSYVKGSVGEPTSLDRQVCITFVIFVQVIFI